MGKAAKGFTLIEFLLVTVILSVVAGAMYATLSQGLRLWKFSRQSAPDLQYDILFEKLTGDIHNIIDHNREPFLGKPGQMTFFSMTERPVKSSSFDMGRELRPIRVVYQCMLNDKNLIRYTEDYTDYLAGETGKHMRKELLMSGLLGCEFSYFAGRNLKGGLHWKTEWTDRCLPSAVQLKITYGKQNNLKELSQAVNIMVGDCARSHGNLTKAVA